MPYRQLVSWDGNYDDYYLVKLADGSRQKILEKEHFGATVSPGGNYILYFDEDDDNWYTVRVSDGQKTNLTKGLGVKFQSETDDRPEHPTPVRSSRLDRRRQVRAALRPLRHLGSAVRMASAPRMLTGGVGRKSADRLPLSPDRAGRGHAGTGEEAGPARQTDEPVIATSRPLLLVGGRRADQGQRPVPRVVRRERRAGQGR